MRAFEGCETPRPAARGTGMNQYNVKNRKVAIAEPTLALRSHLESGKNISFSTQNIPYEP